MLKRRPIRTKLIVALTLLSAIVLLLASSGFWGLYRYRQLANAISQRAMEIQYANELNGLALSLRESNQRTGEFFRHWGMIDELSLCDPLINIKDWEMKRFDAALDGFGLKLELYEHQVANTQEKSLLIDNASRNRSLGFIRSWLSDLQHIRNQHPTMNGSSKSDLTSKLDQLVDQTAEHVSLIQEGMEKFSDEVRGQYRAWIGMAWSCTILAFFMVAALLWALRSLVVKPFRTLLDGSRLVAGGQFDHRIDLGTGDELSELAEAMNDMTDRFQGALTKLNLWCTDLDREVRERTREVIQNEQLASVGFLAAGVAHEINNPLAAVAWSAESLQSRIAEISMLSSDDRLVDDELCEALTTNLRRIEEEAYRCKGITEKLLDFSRMSEVQRGSTDIVELVNDVVTMVGTVGKYRCKTLRTHFDGTVAAHVNPQQIRQVVLNLVTNALESVDHDGAVDVYVRNESPCASVVVEDNGCGMNQEVLRHLFEPFFTRRRDGTGTGLGLSITYRIVSQHGGSLVAKSDGEGCGSRMEMLLPITAESNDGTPQSRNRLGLNTLGFQSPGSSHEPNQAA